MAKSAKFDPAAVAAKIQKLATRKSGVTKAQVLEKIPMTPSQWVRAVTLAKTNGVIAGKGRHATYRA